MTSNTDHRRHSPLHVFSILVLIGLLTALVPGCGSTPGTAVTESDTGGKTAPDFSLTDLQGTAHRLSDYRGKVVVLNFWDTWCGPCRQEIPGFIALQKKYGPDGLQLLGVALGKEGVDRVKAYSSQAGINYPVLLLGTNNDLLGDYGGINSIPATFIIDRKGNIAGQHIGYLSQTAIQAMIAPVLGSSGDKS